MKKNIKQGLLFLLILLAFIYALQYAVDTYYSKKVSQKFTHIFKHNIDPEIMLFGGSTVYHEFDPRIIDSTTGKTTYNMGWDGLFFVQYNALIKEYLSYEKQCKFIVIGCDFENLGKNKLITRPDLFLAYLNNGYVYESLHEIEPDKIFLARFFPGYKFTILNKSFYKDIFIASHDSDKVSGYDPRNEPWDKTGKDEPFNARYEDRIFNELKSTIDEITSKGIKVVLVITPVYDEGYKLILNAEWIKAKYKSLSKKDVYFLDYTTDTICKAKNYFTNYSHLNTDGATIFSHTFAKDLLSITHE